MTRQIKNAGKRGLGVLPLAVFLTAVAPLFAWEPAATFPPARDARWLLRPGVAPVLATLKSVQGQGDFTFELAALEANSSEKTPAEPPPAEPAPGETLRLTSGELVQWGHPAEPRSESLLLTVDGSLLVGSSASFTGDAIQLKGARLRFLTSLFDEVTLPLEAARAIVFQPPADARGKDQLLARLAGLEGAEDLVLFSNGDELRGTVRAIGEGKLTLFRRGGAGGTELELTLATPNAAGQVAAVAFNPAIGKAPAKAPGPRFLVGFEDGSLLVAEKLWRDAEEVRLQLPEPHRTTLTCDRPAKMVSLQPLGFGLAYLSDLAAHSYKHIPYLSLTRPYYSDRNAAGDRLRVAGQLYNKGLGIPSAARLTYVLEKPYRRFEAELAVDDAAELKGSVVCRVYLNIDGAWRPAYESEVIRGGDQPAPLVVDLTGAKAMTLIVDYADRGDAQDLSNWLNARLVE